jgi:hypothetical protein
MDVLIGYTGFVGLNLIKHMKPNTLFINSKNSNELLDREFDTVYCCGVYAEKWKANKYPEEDDKHISQVINNLSRIKCTTFVLISTVDVLDCSRQQTENCEEIWYYDATHYSTHTYGVNRRKLEEWCEKQFKRCFICRLPALFGYGLKKNALWDMLHANNTEKLCAHWSFQWYNIDWLYDDIQTMVLSNSYKIVHLVTPPIKLGNLQALFFPTSKLSDSGPSVNYTIESRYYKKRSLEDLLVCMKQYIDSVKYNKNLLVSELAWNVGDSKVITPWLRSRGILDVEAVPSKVNWDMDTYDTIYSAQSILYGEKINIFREQDRFLTLLEEKLQCLHKRGARLIVFGSPTQRIYNGEELTAFFIKIGDLCKQYDILFCLENNATAYGCNWMTHICDTILFIKKLNHTHLKINFDIGSMIMENEQYTIGTDDVQHIGHVQISFPLLGPWDNTYNTSILKTVTDLYTHSYKGKISLEMKSSQDLPFNSIDSFLTLIHEASRITHV